MNRPVATIFVATPCYDGTVDHRLVTALLDAQRYCAKYGVVFKLFVEAGHSLIQFARNRLATDFLNERDFSHILWLDSDVGFDPRAIVQLVNHGKDVVGGAYPVKDFPMWFPVEPMTAGDSTASLFKAKTLPTGFLLVTRDAMAKVAATVGAYVHHHKRQQLITRHIFDLMLRGDGDVKELIGEDVVLCARLRELGYDLWCDPDISFYHCGRYEWGGNLRAVTEAHAKAAQVAPVIEPVDVQASPGLILPNAMRERAANGDASIPKVLRA